MLVDACHGSTYTSKARDSQGKGKDVHLGDYYATIKVDGDSLENGGCVYIGRLWRARRITSHDVFFTGTFGSSGSSRISIWRASGTQPVAEKINPRSIFISPFPSFFTSASLFGFTFKIYSEPIPLFYRHLLL